MLAEPDRTQFDLNFRVLGFPVRVHPLFWVGSALFGASALDIGLIYLLIWVAVVFVSILVHELGHAVAFRRFGAGAHVILYMFGGLAVPWGHVPGRWRRILVSLAGPAAGFVLCGLVYGSNLISPWADPRRSLPLWWLYHSLIFVNLFWGLINLLPVIPLDGGRVSEEVCSHFFRRDGVRVALKISVAVGGLVAAYSLLCVMDERRGGGLLDALPYWVPRGSLWTAILFGMLAVQSYQMLQQSRWTDSHWDR